MKSTLLVLYLLSILLSGVAAHAQVTYVTPSGAGAQNGSSWNNALSGAGLKDLLNTPSTPGSEIWVAAGTYIPHASSRDSTFNLAVNVRAYGGFAGTEILRAQRNWLANPTILSGNVGLLTDSMDNSYHVVTVKNTNGYNSALDGFTISGSYADNGTLNRSGGGIIILAESSSAPPCTPAFTNCIITNNVATDLGGGAANFGIAGLAAPLFRDCVFNNNKSGNRGGAIYTGSLNGLGGRTDLTVSGSAFTGNYSPYGASALINHCGTSSNNATIRRCTFRDNFEVVANYGTPDIRGYTKGSYKILIDSCRFVRNSGIYGIALANINAHIDTGHLTISNSHFDSNYSTTGSPSGSSIIYFTDTWSGRIHNHIIGCTFSNNAPRTKHNVIRSATNLTISDSLAITNSLFYNNAATPFHFQCIDNGSHVATFTNSTVYLDSAGLSGRPAPATITNVSGTTPMLKPGFGVEAVVLIRNSIFWYSLTAGDTLANHIHNDVQSPLLAASTSRSIVSNSILNHINSGTLAWPPSYGADSGGNSGISPRFADTSRNDFRLLCGSPGIDAGKNAFIAPVLTRDAGGAPRIYNGIVDIGAFETTPALLPPVKAWPVSSVSGPVLTFGASFTGGTDSLSWSFGDGTGSTARSGSHTYGKAGIYTVCLRVFNGCGSADSCFQIAITGTATVEHNPNNGRIRSYPNPARDHIIVEGAAGGMIRVVAATGQTVLQASAMSGKQMLKVTGLSAGTYLLQVTDCNGVSSVSRIVID